MSRRFARTLSMVAVLVVVWAPAARGDVIDDFSDLNDTASPAWTHLSGLVVSTGQTWDGSTGQYRMTAPNNGFSALGFVGSYVDAPFSDVVVSVDIVSFIDGASQGAPFAVAARLNGNDAFNSLQGYAWAYEPFAAAGLGEVALYRITGASFSDLGHQQVTLDPLKDYRLVLEIIGGQLHGQVFDIAAGTMVADVSANDATYASGFAGLFAYSQNPIPPVDVTWDNFEARGPAAVPEPGTALLVGLGAAAMAARRRLMPCRRQRQPRLPVATLAGMR